MVEFLMISVKLANLGFLKIKIFENKGYVIISVHGATSEVLSRESNYIVDLAMWPNFGNPSISIREVVITSIL